MVKKINFVDDYNRTELTREEKARIYELTSRHNLLTRGYKSEDKCFKTFYDSLSGFEKKFISNFEKKLSAITPLGKAWEEYAYKLYSEEIIHDHLGYYYDDIHWTIYGGHL